LTTWRGRADGGDRALDSLQAAPHGQEREGGDRSVYTTRASLLQRLKDPQDAASWKEFFHLYSPLLASYARARGLSADLAEEIVQQCMVTLAEHLKTFEYSKDKGGFKSWLRTMANRKVIDLLKKRHVPAVDLAALEQVQSREPAADEVWEAEWRKHHLMYCLKLVKQEVAPNTYQAFDCYVLKEWPVERVAQTLGVSANKVYVAKTRIEKKLRRKMLELIGDES